VKVILARGRGRSWGKEKARSSGGTGMGGVSGAEVRNHKLEGGWVVWKLGLGFRGGGEIFPDRFRTKGEDRLIPKNLLDGQKEEGFLEGGKIRRQKDGTGGKGRACRKCVDEGGHFGKRFGRKRLWVKKGGAERRGERNQKRKPGLGTSKRKVRVEIGAHLEYLGVLEGKGEKILTKGGKDARKSALD